MYYRQPFWCLLRNCQDVVCALDVSFSRYWSAEHSQELLNLQADPQFEIFNIQENLEEEKSWQACQDYNSSTGNEKCFCWGLEETTQELLNHGNDAQNSAAEMWSITILLKKCGVQGLYAHSSPHLLWPSLGAATWRLLISNIMTLILCKGWLDSLWHDKHQKRNCTLFSSNRTLACTLFFKFLIKQSRMQNRWVRYGFIPSVRSIYPYGKIGLTIV